MNMKGIVILLFAAAVFVRASGVTNTITREIRTVNDEVCVFDTLRLREVIWKTRPELQPIYTQVIEDSSNMMEQAFALLKDENLLPMECKASLEGGFLSFSIVSKISSDSRGVAKLHFVPTYGVIQYRRKIDGIPTEPYFHVYSKPGIRLVWVPAWEAPDNLSEMVKMTLNNLHAVEQVVGTNDDAVEIRCFIRDGANEQTLLSAYPWARVGSAPALRSLNEINQLHPMSGNDAYSLFTDLKPAKPGYYLLDSAGFTNRPPLEVK